MKILALASLLVQLGAQGPSPRAMPVNSLVYGISCQSKFIGPTEESRNIGGSTQLDALAMTAKGACLLY